jgi:hypothetical protein
MSAPLARRGGIEVTQPYVAARRRSLPNSPGYKREKKNVDFIIGYEFWATATII